VPRAAAARELVEETGLRAELLPVPTAVSVVVVAAAVDDQDWGLLSACYSSY
jgi:8-oxo-dGTP pyrophosphatase MutT (NUDIX family)